MSSLQPDRPPEPVAAEHVLPPVEPPSAGFILQLFVVPAIIVLVIVAVYFMFSWLARAGEDPQTYVRDIERNNANSWQAAHNLAIELHRNKALRRDAGLNRTLAALLRRKLGQPLPTGRDRESEVALRVFLCKALGEFEIADQVDILVRGAQPGPSGDEAKVRRASIDALALLIRNARLTAAEQPAVLSALLAAAEDDEVFIRSAAVYALGVLGGDAAQQRLRQMVHDSNPDVRYNAATGLARHGDTACVETLIEMLDPNEDVALRGEEEEFRPIKRGTILINALRAAGQLKKQNPRADTAALLEAARQLRATDLQDTVPAGMDRAIHAEADKLLGTADAPEASRSRVTTPREALSRSK